MVSSGTARIGHPPLRVAAARMRSLPDGEGSPGKAVGVDGRAQDGRRPCAARRRQGRATWPGVRARREGPKSPVFGAGRRTRFVFSCGGRGVVSPQPHAGKRRRDRGREARGPGGIHIGGGGWTGGEGDAIPTTIVGASRWSGAGGRGAGPGDHDVCRTAIRGRGRGGGGGRGVFPIPRPRHNSLRAARE